MQVIAHTAGLRRLAEIKAMKLDSVNDLMTLMLHARIHRADGIILDQVYVSPEFFRLESGLAGQVLQALANYRFTLAIVGDISRFTETSEILRNLVREANRGKDLRFDATIADVIAFIQR